MHIHRINIPIHLPHNRVINAFIHFNIHKEDKAMAIWLIGVSTLLLAFAALCSTGVALFLTWQIGRKNKSDCTFEQTRLVKAIEYKRVPRELREFSMLGVDTSAYLQSVKVFSKKEEPRSNESILPKGQFKRSFRKKSQFKTIRRLGTPANERNG